LATASKKLNLIVTKYYNSAQTFSAAGLKVAADQTNAKPYYH